MPEFIGTVISFAAATLAGIWLGPVAGTSFATYSWDVQRLMAEGVGRAAAKGAAFRLGGLLLLPVLVTTSAPLVETAHALVVDLYMALVPMFLGYLAFGYEVSHISASFATTLTLIEAAVATVLAV